MTTPSELARMVERNRKVLMERHAHEWEMETVSEAAHLAAEVSAHTGRARPDALNEIDAAVSLFQYDSVRQRALYALRDALRSDIKTASLTGGSR